MKITVNGVELEPLPGQGIVIEIDVDEQGETLGPIEVVHRGGCLTIDGRDKAALLLRTESKCLPYLIMRTDEPGVTGEFTPRVSTTP